jgi:hypothetical protein
MCGMVCDCRLSFYARSGTRQPVSGTRQPVLVVTIRGGVKAVTTSEHIYRIMKIVLDGVLFWCTL